MIKSRHIPLLLIGLTLAVFGRSIPFDFVGFDDNLHVISNPLLHPVSGDHLKQMWTEPYRGVYMPVTYSHLGRRRRRRADGDAGRARRRPQPVLVSSAQRGLTRCGRAAGVADLAARDRQRVAGRGGGGGVRGAPAAGGIGRLGVERERRARWDARAIGDPAVPAIRAAQLLVQLRGSAGRVRAGPAGQGDGLRGAGRAAGAAADRAVGRPTQGGRVAVAVGAGHAAADDRHPPRARPTRPCSSGARCGPGRWKRSMRSPSTAASWCGRRTWPSTTAARRGG